MKIKFKQKQIGFAMIEYIIAASFVMIILFTGSPKSLAAQVVDGLKNYYKALTFIISLP